jgi:hypothetical protein
MTIHWYGVKTALTFGDELLKYFAVLCFVYCFERCYFD